MPAHVHVGEDVRTLCPDRIIKRCAPPDIRLRRDDFAREDYVIPRIQAIRETARDHARQDRLRLTLMASADDEEFVLLVLDLLEALLDLALVLDDLDIVEAFDSRALRRIDVLGEAAAKEKDLAAKLFAYLDDCAKARDVA